MRFCTTHRACELETGGVCDVHDLLSALMAEKFKDEDYAPALKPCTPVDALIVTKENGEWPKWAIEKLRYDVAALAECGAGEILDALERAEP